MSIKYCDRLKLVARFSYTCVVRVECAQSVCVCLTVVSPRLIGPNESSLTMWEYLRPEGPSWSEDAIRPSPRVKVDEKLGSCAKPFYDNTSMQGLVELVFTGDIVQLLCPNAAYFLETRCPSWWKKKKVRDLTLTYSNTCNQHTCAGVSAQHWELILTKVMSLLPVTWLWVETQNCWPGVSKFILLGQTPPLCSLSLYDRSLR